MAEMKQLVYSENLRQSDDSAAQQTAIPKIDSINKKQPSELLAKIQRVRGAAFYLLDALVEVQPFVNGWQGSDEGRAIAMRVNAAIGKALGADPDTWHVR